MLPWELLRGPFGGHQGCLWAVCSSFCCGAVPRAGVTQGWVCCGDVDVTSLREPCRSAWHCPSPARARSGAFLRHSVGLGWALGSGKPSFLGGEGEFLLLLHVAIQQAE